MEIVARENSGSLFGAGGFVDQSFDLGQFAGTWNGIEIDSGVETAAAAEIYNVGEIYSLNVGIATLFSNQENSGGFAGGAYGVEEFSCLRGSTLRHMECHRHFEWRRDIR